MKFFKRNWIIICEVVASVLFIFLAVVIRFRTDDPVLIDCERGLKISFFLISVALLFCVCTTILGRIHDKRWGCYPAYGFDYYDELKKYKYIGTGKKAIYRNYEEWKSGILFYVTKAKEKGNEHNLVAYLRKHKRDAKMMYDLCVSIFAPALICMITLILSAFMTSYSDVRVSDYAITILSTIFAFIVLVYLYIRNLHNEIVFSEDVIEIFEEEP